MSVCAPLYLLIFFPSSTPAPSPNLLTMIIYHLTCPSCCLLSFFLTFHLQSLSFPPCVYCPCPCWLSQRRRSNSELFVLPCKLQWNFKLLSLFKLRFGCKKDAINMYFLSQGFLQHLGPSCTMKTEPRKFVKSDKNFLLHLLLYKLVWQEISYLLSSRSTSVIVSKK